MGTMMVVVVAPFVDRRARPDHVGKAFSFRNSSRRRPLKLSTLPFCIGRPGSIKCKSMFRFALHVPRRLTK
jgi:hypothetical protein